MDPGLMMFLGFYGVRVGSHPYNLIVFFHLLHGV